MRSKFAGIILLSASIAVVHPAQADNHPQRPPAYGSMQTPMGHRQPSDDLKAIEKDNDLNNLPASQDNITGAVPLESKDDALTNKLEQDDARLHRLINGICPICEVPMTVDGIPK